MKRIEVTILESLIDKCFPIRDKVSVAVLLINVISGLQYASKIPTGCPNTLKLCIAIEKMSRLFIPVADSIHSVHFPFPICQNEEGFEVTYLGRPIESIHSSFIQTVLSNDVLLTLPLDDMIDFIWQTQDEYKEFTEEEKIFVFRLLWFLLTYEPGYLRYDYDPLKANSDLHPIHHMDVFFSGKATCKLGLMQRASIDDLIDILDLRTDCHYLEKSRIEKNKLKIAP